ncbi:MAG: hypothetical protein LBF62_15145 [Tannerellaceae bacterium]|jgi:hypothetical protein|nr:hypothetical protein [Tannerellaceae bacterium]
MKTQLAKTAAILGFLFITMAAYAGTMDANNDKLKGNWSYSLPDAPYGYQDGSIEFKETDGKLTAVARIGTSSYTIKEIKKEGDTYHCNLSVDGSDVKVSIKPDKEELRGTVIADGWEMPVTFKKIKE